MSLFANLKLRLRLFRDDVRASLSVETVLVMPLLTWWYVGSFVYFDAFREQNVNLKAAYTVADMLSREETAIDMDYLNGLNKVFDYLTTTNKPTWVRVTSIYWSETEKKYKMSWSRATKSKAVHTEATINAKASRIPKLVDGDYVFIVETNAAYEPFFNVGLGARWFENFIVTRSRMPCLAWKDIGC